MSRLFFFLDCHVRKYGRTYRPYTGTRYTTVVFLSYVADSAAVLRFCVPADVSMVLSPILLKLLMSLLLLFLFFLALVVGDDDDDDGDVFLLLICAGDETGSVREGGPQRPPVHKPLP